MRNNIRLVILVLLLCAGAFFMPMTAHAENREDTTPPYISAELSGDMLHIEAGDDDTGVDAIYINGKRINYRVDNALDLVFEDFADMENETVSVYAIDFAGNQSETVEVKNPYYKAPEKPFTPDGQATVADNATDGDGKEFYTFTTPDENVFYLVIDKQRESENVYFLNAVTESDLYALAEKNKKQDTDSESTVPEAPVCSCVDKCEIGKADISCAVCKNDLTLCRGTERIPPEPEEPIQEEPKKKNGGTFIFILIAALAVGCAGYYIKIYKPKQDLDDAEDLDDLFGDDTEVNEDDGAAEQTKMQGFPADGAGMESGMGDMAAYDDYPDEDRGQGE